MNILVFDNYDSFTYNLVHLVEKITAGKVDVYRNDRIELEQVKAYDKIILSPGPGIPEEAVERMKRPFTRLDTARSNAIGAGLGLAIVDRIIRTHNGRLDLLPRPQGGLIARITLPGS